VSRLFTALLTLALAGALAAAVPAHAEIEPGNIPAETIQSAYQTQPGFTYQGAFEPDTVAGYHDLDYLAFTVTNPGETLEFTVQNTTQGVDPNRYEWCPVYASILNGANILVANGAGTVATYQDTEVFDWTFASAGTYYLVMESNGDMPAGDPTYAVSYAVVAPGAAAGSGTPGSAGANPGQPAPKRLPLVRSLRVLEKQHGRSVTATIRLGMRSSLMASLFLPGVSRPVTVTRASLKAGRHKLVLRLPSLDWGVVKRSGLSLALRISVRGAAGASATYARPVTLSR
jgi:hypothetical protein